MGYLWRAYWAKQFYERSNQWNVKVNPSTQMGNLSKKRRVYCYWMVLSGIRRRSKHNGAI